ncbi:MAG: histidinol dehydrogenase, partial [Myxococcota bacterium]|nr:histidinol dehydrogenase [Myxococcota bacterium]
MPSIPIYTIPSEEARAAVGRLAERGAADLRGCEEEVRAIVDAVRRNGDDAIRELTRRFEGRILTNIEVGAQAIERAGDLVDGAVREAIDLAVDRVRSYHRRQVEPAWTYREGGVLLGQIVRAVRRVGMYAPGGTARYPSSVVM